MNETGTAASDTLDDVQLVEEKRLRQRERLRILASLRQWWRRNFVKSVDQHEAIRRVKDEGGLDGRYIFMTSMSAGIAVLGLIQSSPAVVIGAMLLSPLMGPIMSAGFAIAIGDINWLKKSAWCLFYGVIAGIVLSAIITFMSPIQTVTSEIASRTRPTLLDLFVAFFSALAGAYAMIKGRQGTIVGVAIATALMPPLAVVGFGLATWNWTVFGGALMLFTTNLFTIALTTAVMARFYGFRTNLSKKQTQMQVIGIVTAFVLLAVPLTYSLRQIAWEANAQRAVNRVLEREFGGRARLADVDVNFDADPISVTATVLTPSFNDEAEARAAASLTDTLGDPVVVALDQFRVGAAEDAEAAEIAAARQRAQSEASERVIRNMINELALVAGVPSEAVTVDRDNRRATVRANPLEGATLAAYRELERRIARQLEGWDVRLQPPARTLPAITYDENGTPDPAAVALAAWAQPRVGAPIVVTGPGERAEQLAVALRLAGAVDVVTREGSGEISIGWGAPDIAD